MSGCPWTSAEECSTAAERIVAGTDEELPVCRDHLVEALKARHARLVRQKVWSALPAVERDLRRLGAWGQPVELAQDAYYYGTAADLR